MVFEPIIKRIHTVFFRDVIGSAPVRRELADITLGNSFCKTVVWPVVVMCVCVCVCCVRVRCMRACVVCARACVCGGEGITNRNILFGNFLS